ncbi:S9 family peptidase [uncultured Parasphingopyxis sp.]|uniref:alpha/beta hydrolase family protein n=1 Tax=uncultured Parasphingopyxis sp. TaxID=1547918 RepID=UPI00260CC255|nr:alpha/beta hydrolase [uncultured Parasphingopyxis sp.]
MAENDPSAAPPSPASAGEPARDIMVWDDLLSRAQPEPDHRIAYGEGDLQFSELWLPIVDGIPASGHPTVLMIHGGCWQTDIAERDIMNWIAGDLRDRGIAVWNIEYRGVDREGGGWPGTYEDVLAAAASLVENAGRYNLDISNTVAIGHSAGGHLALWLAARQSALPGDGALDIVRLPIGTVISQGGLPDLEAGTRREGHACGTEAPRLMMGENPTLTSPQRMPAPSAHQILVNGARDRIAPPDYAEAYRNANLARDVTDIALVTIPDEGHVELISPGTAAWERQVELIEEALGRR